MMHLLLVLLFAAAPVFAQTPPAEPLSPKPDYMVGPQDVLKVTVFDEPQLSGTFRVDTDGTFTYPFIGRLNAVGQTLRTIEAELTKRLADGYVRRPQVTIEVESSRSRSVTVMGEVRTPAKYPLLPGMTLIDAIAQAGGTTSGAGTEVLILHAPDGKPQPVGTGSTPSTRTTRVNIADVQSGKILDQHVLREGDTVVVPKAERFYVTGQVKNPGPYVYERGMTVLQALSLAGGLTDKGSNRRIRIIRLVDGKEKEVSVSLSDRIQANDTIVVKQRLL